MAVASIPDPNPYKFEEANPSRHDNVQTDDGGLASTSKPPHKRKVRSLNLL